MNWRESHPKSNIGRGRTVYTLEHAGWTAIVEPTTRDGTVWDRHLCTLYGPAPDFQRLVCLGCRQECFDVVERELATLNP